jgi:neutral trehalase
VQNSTWALTNIVTTAVLPVELNAFLYRMEMNLARLAELANITASAQVGVIMMMMMT